MSLQQPYWFLLAVPLGILWIKRPLPSKLLNHLRLPTLICILIALSDPTVIIPSRLGTVIVVADRSLSMPPEKTASQIETIHLIQADMNDRNRLGVVTFGQKAVIEQAPQYPTQGKFDSFLQEVDPDGSDLAAALEASLALIPKDTPGRILLLSDGRWTGRDPQSAALSALAKGVAIDYRYVQPYSYGENDDLYASQSINDVSIEALDVPESVAPNESYLIKADLSIPVHQQVGYKLYRNQTLIASGKSYVSESHKRLLFRDKLQRPDTVEYQLEISGFGHDPVPENNKARTLMAVKGTRPILLIGSNPQSGLKTILEQNGFKLQFQSPEEVSWNLTTLSKYAALILENVPASAVGEKGLESISQWVQTSGSGLFISGGMQSYALGGYFRSPLEPILPLSMELRSEHRKLALAMAVVLDRSGSMAMLVGRGRTKMDLANTGTVQILDILSPLDEFGVIAVDSKPHLIIDLAKVENKASDRNRILHIGPMGGGIFVYSGLLAAADMLQKATAGTRHILLFADAADAEEPGKYKALLKKCTDADITVSVVGLGKASDQDGNFLKDIAQRGQGRCFFTDNPEEIPRLFAQDTFSVMRGAFIKGLASLKSTASLLQVSGSPWEDLPRIEGYNLCYLRPGANAAIISQDEYKAPILSYWQAGSGRVICYTGEADGKYTGPIAEWDKIGEFFSGITRWAAGDDKNLPFEIRITRKVVKGMLIVECHLDPERTQDLIRTAPQVAILRESPKHIYSKETIPMEWISPDTLSCRVPLSNGDTVMPVVHLPGLKTVSLTPACLPYSPEFKASNRRHDRAALNNLARMTGGKERISLKDIQHDIVKKPHVMEVRPGFVLAALILFLLETYCRRTGTLAIGLHFFPFVILRRFFSSHRERLKKAWRIRSLIQKQKRSIPSPEVPQDAQNTKMDTQEKTTKKPPADPKEAQSRAESALLALKQAKHIAKKRIDGN